MPPPVVGVIAAVAVYGGLFLGAAIWPRVMQADIAVVFGSQVLGDGRPSGRLAARLDEAARVYGGGLVRLILVSGGKGASGFDEAATMRAYLLHAGISGSAILVDSEGGDTRATARNAVAVMRARGLRSVLVVTQYFHVPRCILALRIAGATKVGATYPAYIESRDAYSFARELVALPAYALRLP